MTAPRTEPPRLSNDSAVRCGACAGAKNGVDLSYATQSNQGKAAAIRTGLVYADTELTVIHDADLEYHPQDLIKMVKVFLAGAGGRCVWLAFPRGRLPARALLPA